MVHMVSSIKEIGTCREKINKTTLDILSNKML